MLKFKLNETSKNLLVKVLKTGTALLVKDIFVLLYITDHCQVRKYHDAVSVLIQQAYTARPRTNVRIQLVQVKPLD